jgi:ribose 1,5-bisphosphate isomerase
VLPVERAARDIESMRVRGAGRLARHAVQALQDVALAHAGTDAALRRDLQKAAQRLIATRPTAVSLRNAVEEAIAPLSEPNNGTLRADVVGATERFIHRSHAAVERISDLGADLLGGEGVVLTHCNSACSVGVIARAHEQWPALRAYASETRPRRQGLLTARQLRSHRVPVTYIVDSAVNLVMPGVDWVVVGADTIAANGDVVNKVGTSMVALSAREHGVPVYVAAETYKVAPWARTGAEVHIEERDPREIADGRTLPGIKLYNPVFDVTPARFVKRIVTEAGVVPPSRVLAQVRKARAPRRR